MAFNLDNYEEVKDRIPLFFAKHEDGRIITELVSSPENFDTCRYKATLFATAEDQEKNLPLSTGHAFENQGGNNVNRTSHEENCETSAIGRALANIGLHGDKRPSREEMDKVERHTKITPKPAQNPPQGEPEHISANKHSRLESLITKKDADRDGIHDVIAKIRNCHAVDVHLDKITEAEYQAITKELNTREDA